MLLFITDINNSSGNGYICGSKKELNKKMRLSELKTGQKAYITRVNGNGAFRKRILEMGVTPGSVVELKRSAPLGDPIDVKVRGYHLSLRKDEAEGIDVEVI